MSIRIEERFQLRASPDRVWEFVADPRRIVRCLPGAELTGEEGADTYLGRVKVKVGPILAAYEGRARVESRDEAQRVVRIVGTGTETGGSGSASMTLTSRVTGLDDGGAEVHVSADVDLVGKIVQFGRGMIESVNKQLFKQFVACVRTTLEGAEAGAAAATPPTGEVAAASPAVSDTTSAPPPRGDGAPVAASSAPSLAATATVATERPPATPLQPATAPAPALAMRATPAPAAFAPREATPVRALPLLFHALWEMITRPFRALGRMIARLFGRSAS